MDKRRGAAAPVRKKGILLRELERERGRIARDLHAGAAQPLAALCLNLSRVEESAHDLPAAAREALERAHRLADAALEQIRSSSHRLHPPAWQGLRLEEALERLVADSAAEVRFREVRVEIPHLPVEPCFGSKIAAYRCAQEALSNALRHSNGDRISLSVSYEGVWMLLTVFDNGDSFAEPPAVRSSGLGLRAMRRHVRAAGGSLRIAGGSNGTTIQVRLPIAGE